MMKKYQKNLKDKTDRPYKKPYVNPKALNTKANKENKPFAG